MKKVFDEIKMLYIQLNYILSKKQKVRSFWLLVMIIIGAFMEMLGVTLIVPFIQAILSPEIISQNIMIFKGMDQKRIIIIVGLFLVFIYIIKNGYLLFLAYIKAKFQCNIEKDLCVRMLDSYLKRPYTFHLDTDSGKLISGVSVDTNGVYVIIMQICTILAEVFSMILIGGFIIISDWEMAVAVFILVGSGLAVVTLGCNNYLRKLGDKFRIYNEECYQHLTQALAGIKEVKISNKEEYFVNRYEEQIRNKSKTVIAQNFMTAFPAYFIEGLAVSGILIVLVFKVALGENLASSIPQLASFAVAAFRILPSAGKITAAFNNIIFYRKTLGATYSNIHEVNEYEEKQKRLREIHKESYENNDGIIEEFKKGLQLEGIFWKYPNAEKEVLKGLDLHINKGDSIAIIGASGAGKSTLTDILLGLFQPQRGTIKIDGVDIMAITSKWRNLIGYVPQTIFLTNSSLKENVAFGVCKEDIDERKIWKALEQAQLREFVEKLPDGINTIVGERGVKFSGGQRQRVAIARALYNSPEIIILDEATSALDNETEKMVMESIDALHGKKTMIIIAHRLTTVANCDFIYEISEGVAVRKDKKEVLGGRG